MTTFPDPVRVLVITVSDRASAGVYEDLSGPILSGTVKDYFAEHSVPVEVSNAILPDEPDRLKSLILKSVREGMNVIFTSGGTGLGARDFTPDVVRRLLDKEIPGVMELIRVKYGTDRPVALLSRSVAGVTGQTLIYCLPGSRRAVAEYSADILPTIIHSLKMILGIDDHSC